MKIELFVRNIFHNAIAAVTLKLIGYILFTRRAVKLEHAVPLDNKMEHWSSIYNISYNN